MTTPRQEQIDAKLRERQAVALERIVDLLAGIDDKLAALANYVDHSGDSLIETVDRIGDAARRAYPPSPSDRDFPA